MQVPILTIVFLVLNGLVGIVLPLGVLLVLRRRLGLGSAAFCVGCLTFVLSALVLENGAHYLVLTSPLAPTIQGNIWLYALYGGLMAGIFEETGRLAAMLVLKKKHPAPGTCLLYGAGHGGIEIILVMGIPMVQNLVFALIGNAGQLSSLTEGMTPEQTQALTAQLGALAQTSPWLFLVSPVERMIALTLHITFSILVWRAVTQPGSFLLFFAAIGVHTLVDASAVAMQSLGVPVLLIELWLLLLAAGMVIWAKKIYKAM